MLTPKWLTVTFDEWLSSSLSHWWLRYSITCYDPLSSSALKFKGFCNLLGNRESENKKSIKKPWEKDLKLEVCVDPSIHIYIQLCYTYQSSFLDLLDSFHFCISRYYTLLQIGIRYFFPLEKWRASCYKEWAEPMLCFFSRLKKHLI